MSAPLATRSPSVHGGIRRALSVGLITLAAGSCGSSAESTGAEPEAVVASVSPQVSTVVAVTWTTAAPSIGYVEYGTTPEFGSSTPVEAAPATTHALALRGLTSDTELYYRVVTWADGDAAAGEVGTIRTGSLPASIPSLVAQAGEFDQFTVLPVSGTPPAVTVVGPDGRVVWYHLDSRGLELYRARFAGDGSILYSAASPATALDTPGSIVRVAFDGTETVIATLPSLVGDFAERPDGTIAAVVAEVRDVGGVATRGDSIVELGAGGLQTVVWSAWDCFDPAVHAAVLPEEGWAVVDGLQLDPGNEAYYVGIKSLGSIARVNRATRGCDWVVGQTGATVTYAEGVAPILGQRQFEAKPGSTTSTGLTLIDTSADGTLRAAEYKVNLTAGVATLGWSGVGPVAKAGALLLGQPSRLTTTKVFVNWATEGSAQVIDSSGAVTWAVTAPEGVRFGLHALTADLYASP